MDDSSGLVVGRASYGVSQAGPESAIVQDGTRTASYLLLAPRSTAGVNPNTSQPEVYMAVSLKSLIESWEGIGVVMRYDQPTGTWIFITF